MRDVKLPDHIVEEARRGDVLVLARQQGAQLRQSGAEHIGPCPVCGGHDRFAVNTEKNIFLCRQSGAGGDAIALWRYLNNGSFADAVSALTGWQPDTNNNSNHDGRPLVDKGHCDAAARPKPIPCAAAHQSNTRNDDSNPWRDKARRDAYDLWCKAVRQGPLVKAYLKARGLAELNCHPPVLRELPSLAYWHKPEGASRSEIIHTGPAMVAAITGPDGKFIGLHRTWLQADGAGKAEIFCPVTGEQLQAKKVLGSMAGGKIELIGRCAESKGDCPSGTFAGSARATAPAHDENRLIIGEGIETALSWLLVNGFHYSAWAGVSLGNIAGRAAGSVAHPTEFIVDKRRRKRARRVPSGKPHPQADEKALIVPECYEHVIFLGDGDSDYFATRLAMKRAVIRAGEHRSIADFAPEGKDWNDVLREAA